MRGLHKEHGVVFRLGAKPAEIRAGEMELDSGEVLAADLTEQRKEAACRAARHGPQDRIWPASGAARAAPPDARQNIDPC
ncbi:MAG TPA: hypothetical protein VEG34_09865 [Thermoanaerobaculia bacterium]|nr:hypothetical protein [Thermoanaerobaculia bacterium]